MVEGESNAAKEEKAILIFPSQANEMWNFDYSSGLINNSSKNKKQSLKIQDIEARLFSKSKSLIFNDLKLYVLAILRRYTSLMILKYFQFDI